ncbi:MAG: hypothetical protein ACOYN3_01170 [Acidimicrobiia bacterium]
MSLSSRPQSDLERQTRFSTAPAQLMECCPLALASDDYHALRNLTLNPYTPDPALRPLLARPEVRLHRNIAEHPNASGETLDHLALGIGVPNRAKHTVVWLQVECTLAHRPDLPQLARKHLLASTSIATRIALAQRPDLDDADLVQLSHDERREVRRAVALVLSRVPARRPELLVALRSDPDHAVREHAYGRVFPKAPQPPVLGVSPLTR